MATDATDTSDTGDKGEDDVSVDPQVATSRATGGVGASGDDDGTTADNASTTGTSDTPEYVGRIAGDDVGYAGETGAERRSEAHRIGVAEAQRNAENESAG
jgi:hypothetical protein